MGLKSTQSQYLAGLVAFYAVSSTLLLAEMTVKPSDTEILVNSSAFLNCTITSQEVEWLADSLQYPYIYSARKVKSFYMDRFRVETSNRSGRFDLLISHIKASDAGLFICRELETGIDQQAQLIVLDSEPKCIKTIVKEFNVSNSCEMNSERAKLSCIIDYFGNKAPDLEWIKENTTVNSSLIGCSDSNNRRTCNLTLEVDNQINGSSYSCQTTIQHYRCAIEVVTSLNADCSSQANVHTITSSAEYTTQPNTGNTVTITTKDAKLTKGQIIGTVIGVLSSIAIASIVSYVIYRICRKHRKKPRKTDEESISLSQRELKNLLSNNSLDYNRNIVLQSKSRVRGLAILETRLYISVEKRKSIKVYDAVSLKKKSSIKVKGLVDPGTMVACCKNSCLYVIDKRNDRDLPKIFKFTPGGESKVLPLLSIESYGRLSITSDGNIILSAYTIAKLSKLIEYAPPDQQLRHIEFNELSKIGYLWHAVKLSNEEYVLSHGQHYPESDLHRVCKVDSHGILIKSFGRERGSGNDKLNEPTTLLKLDNGSFLVADFKNHRILKLNADLEFMQVLFTRESAINYPETMCLDKTKSLLFVGCNRELDGNGYVLRFSLQDTIR